MSRRRHTRRSRGALAAGALIAAVAAAGAVAISTGVIVIDGTPRTAAGALLQPDTSAGTVDLGTAPGVRPPIGAPGRADSIPLPALRPPAAVPPAESPAADSVGADSLATGHGPGVAAPPRAAGATPNATAAELSALAARLVVPVAGVDRDQLVDSYDDARGERGADTAGGRRHDALDILAPRGTPVLAATAGRVLKLFDSRLGGLTVYTTDESERFVLLYAHLDRYAPGLREGARVRQGEMLGYVGTTGNANPATPHLHFAIARTGDAAKWWQGTPVNPYPLLRGR